MNNELYQGFYSLWALWIPWEVPFFTIAFSVADAVLFCCHPGCGKIKESLFCWVGALALYFDFALIAGMVDNVSEEFSLVFVALWYKYFTTQMLVYLFGVMGSHAASSNLVPCSLAWRRQLHRPYIFATFAVDLIVMYTLMVILSALALLLAPFNACHLQLHRRLLFRTQ